MIVKTSLLFFEDHWGSPYFQTKPQLTLLQPGGHSKPFCWAQSPRWDSASRADGRWGECTWLHQSTIGQPHRDAPNIPETGYCGGGWSAARYSSWCAPEWASGLLPNATRGTPPQFSSIFPIQIIQQKGCSEMFGALSFRSFRCQPWHHNVGRRPPEPHTVRNRPQLRFPGTGHLPLRPLRSLRLRQWFSAPRQMQGSTAQNQPEPIPRLRKTMKTKGDFQNAQHRLNIIKYHSIYIYIFFKKKTYLSVCLSVYLSIDLSIDLSNYIYCMRITL